MVTEKVIYAFWTKNALCNSPIILTLQTDKQGWVH